VPVRRRRVDEPLYTPVSFRAVVEHVLDLEAIADVRLDVLQQEKTVRQLADDELVGTVDVLVAQSVPDHRGTRVAAAVRLPRRPRDVDADAVEYQRAELHFQLSM